MGTISQLNPAVAAKEGLVELNFHIRDQPKAQDGITVEEQGLSEEDESKINELAEDETEGSEEDVAAKAAHQCRAQKQQQQQQQPQGPLVRWERFLPVRTLKVLLVENDDSTRQVLCALLRNCSYEVTAAENGLQAWKLLEDMTNHVDLVLTEVVMPYLSGIDLLCKIMNHKTCKTIPVIMMSSNDSMGTVFKCLSKGAVDFLVKPIRKNELKNLWQHVWRRCRSSSGSGSESGIQTQKSAKKCVGDSDNHTGSNDEDDNGSIGLNARDGSDNGSGTQNSWTKCAVEVDSPQPMSPSDQLADPHDSTCAQVIHPKPESFCNGWVPIPTTKDGQQQKQLSDNNSMGKDLELGVPRTDVQPESRQCEKVTINQSDPNVNKVHDNNTERRVNGSPLEQDNSDNTGEQGTHAADLIGGIAKTSEVVMVTGSVNDPNGFAKISESTVVGSNDLPSLELSLKRLRSSDEDGTATYDERNVLRHSNQSAFSRYNTSVASVQAPNGYKGSCSLPLDNSSDAVKTDSTYNMTSNSNGAPLKQGSNGSSNNNDMGSSTKIAFTKIVAAKEKLPSTLAIKCASPTSAFHPVQHQTPATQQVVSEKVDEAGASGISGHSRTSPQLQVMYHHHHYHHHHHLVHSMQQQQQQQQQQQIQPPPEHDDLPLKNMVAAALQCGSSNVFVMPIEGESGSGCANGGVGWSRNGSGADQNASSQREAALNKFRQKRKERNFEKKVRYQSRKRLAEQRPRVRGQFVRQIIYEDKRREADS
ncbi:putative response regulator and transcription factor RR-A-type family [Dioscorea sansibarensis]